MRQKLLIGALVAAAIAAGVVWFLDNYEYVDEPVYVGFQGEARRNALLAAQRFLQALGFPVRTADTLADLGRLPAPGVLVVGADRWALPREVETQLLAWVREGNTLILEVKPSGLYDPLASALAIDRTYISHEGAPSPEAHPSAQPRSRQRMNGNGPGEEGAGDVPESRPRPLQGALYTLPWAPGRALRIVLATWQSISLEKGEVEFVLGEDRGAYVIGFPLGQGRVVVFNNFLPWFNWNIGNADNALFIKQIAERQGQVPIVFFRNPVKLSPWAWLLEHAGTALLAGAVLLGLTLWRTLVRSGPLVADLPAAQRRWVDHIEASGRFLWRSHARAKLVMRAREAAFSSLQQSVPGFSALAAARRKDILVQQFGFSVEEADQLLGRPGTSASALVSETRLLRRLHRASDRRRTGVNIT